MDKTVQNETINKIETKIVRAQSLSGDYNYYPMVYERSIIFKKWQPLKQGDNGFWYYPVICKSLEQARKALEVYTNPNRVEIVD